MEARQPIGERARRRQTPSDARNSQARIRTVR
jgi:hypothetical protein